MDKFVSMGDTVTLDGSASFDVEDPPSLLTFQWSQVETVPGKAYTSVAIADGDKAIATFTAPSSVETLTFRLTVTDTARHSATDDVHVTVLEDTGHAIFVSSTLGDDSHPNAGTREHPFRTLLSAVVVAQQTDGTGRRSDLYLQAGSYFPADNPWFRLVLLDDMSIYGGFDARRSDDSTVAGWTRTASKSTVVYSLSRIMCTVEQQQYPITIDGLKIASYDAPAGSYRKSLAGGPFSIFDGSWEDINEVWLLTSLDGWHTATWTLLTSDFTTYDTRAYYDDSWRYNVERSFDLPKLHNPAQEPNVEPYYEIRYYEQDIFTGDPPIPNWYYLCETIPFAPQIHYLEGYELIKETFKIYEWGNSFLVQYLRGPDGELYQYYPPYPWNDYPGEGPFPLIHSASTDLIDEGLPGADSVGIHVLKTNNSLRITNNVIIAGRGGNGGHGTDGGDGGAWGNGGDGGNSIGILVDNGLPLIGGNIIETSGGGNGGTGAYGGNGGNSTGIKMPHYSWASSGYRNNNFQVGPSGVGGSGLVPENNGASGYQMDISPPPPVIMTLQSSSIPVSEGLTSTSSITIQETLTRSKFTS